MKRMQPTQFINDYLKANCLKLDLLLMLNELANEGEVVVGVICK